MQHRAEKGLLGVPRVGAQLAGEPAEFRQDVVEFLDALVSHYVLDDGRLVVAHAGMKAEMQGRGSGAVRKFALYGETTGETDEFGLPVRVNWAAEYRGRASVVYGHTPVPAAEWLNRTINIDTGCVFGGRLTALRYPEKEFVSVAAKAVYCPPVRPVPACDALEISLTAQQQHDDLLDAARIDGAGELRIFATIVLPLIRPILVTLAAYTFMAAWNDFLWPLIILSDSAKYTLPVALASLVGEHVQDTELMMAGAVVTVLPALGVFLAIQRQYVRGIMAGGVKG